MAERSASRSPAVSALARMTIGVVSFELSVLGPAVALYGISKEARQHGYATRWSRSPVWNGMTSGLPSNPSNSDTIDGVIVLTPLLDATTVLEGLDIGVPGVTFQQGSQPSLTSVSVDEVRGARIVVRHLLDARNSVARSCPAGVDGNIRPRPGMGSGTGRLRASSRSRSQRPTGQPPRDTASAANSPQGRRSRPSLPRTTSSRWE